MRRLIVLLVFALAVAPCQGGEQNPDRQKEPQTYESPILSLLFLPANVLIKMASIFAPADQNRPSKPAQAPKDGSSR